MLEQVYKEFTQQKDFNDFMLYLIYKSETDFYEYSYKLGYNTIHDFHEDLMRIKKKYNIEWKN